MTDSRLYLQAVVPSIEGDVVGKGGRKVGDLMRAGVVISNSEVGLGRVDDGARFRARLDKMSGLAAVELADPVKAIELLPAILPVTDGEKNSILKSLISGGDLSAWGLLNAVTYQAHAAADYDRGVEFEAMGGRLLNLPDTEWKRVLEAA